MDFIIKFVTEHASLISFLITLFYVFLSLSCAIHILLYKEDIKGSISWLGIVFLSPFIGAVLYIFLGINRVRRKAVKLRKKGNILDKFTRKQIETFFENLPLNSRQFIIYGHNVYSQNFTAGNTVQPFQNGTQAYPAMIELIKNAKKEVLVQSYIFDCDYVADQFLEAFKSAIKNGAKVKVLVDGIGTLHFFRRSIEKKLAGIEGLEYGVFLPPQIPIALPFVNMRNHRKIMIIDGKTAFFGGMNLSKNDTLVNDKEKGVLDITFKIEGPVIDQLSQVFEDDWEFTTGKSMQACSKDLPNIEVGYIPARVVPDGPDNEQGKIEFLVHGTINVATKRITIVTPYFLPESNILTALEMAAMKGVEVEIIIPEISDHRIMNWAEEPNFRSLLKKGVKIYRTPRPFDHSKIFIVDNELVYIGSANWDVRSFRLHFECNMELMSKELAQELNLIIDQKKSIAKQVLIEDTENLSFLKRLRNNAFRLITPYY